MASWMIHLRVAEALYKEIGLKHRSEFVLGNIAPDSGVPVEDGDGFVPDAAISHFRSVDENGIKDVHEESFLKQYFSEEARAGYTPKEYAFFFGYLVHLLTDKIWAREIAYAAKRKFEELFTSAPDEFWRRIKKDWYDLDFMYLKEHPDFEAFQIYRCNGSEDMKNVYLGFFAEDAFEKRREFITEFYRKGAANIVEHETYLSLGELDAFVKETVCEIAKYCEDYILEIRQLEKGINQI